MKKVVLVSNSLTDTEKGASVSNAGADVQRTIIAALTRISKFDVAVLDCSPSGRLVSEIDCITSISSVKTSGLFRRLTPVIFFNVFRKLLVEKPDLIVTYNLYIQQLMAICLYKFIYQKKAIAFIQDFRVGKQFTLRQVFVDRICLNFIRFFDFCIPITESLSRLIPLPRERKMVYKGGVTSISKTLVNNDDNKQENYAIFAGFLSAYNGVDKIIGFWLENNPDCNLVIYGDGPLRDLALDSSKVSSRIQYRGVASHSVVMQALSKSKFNFCLRYSEGIDARFFYPSKFFLGAKSNSLMLYNVFEELIDEFNITQPFVIEADLSNLKHVIDEVEYDDFIELKILQHRLLERIPNLDDILEDALTSISI